MRQFPALFSLYVCVAVFFVGLVPSPALANVFQVVEVPVDVTASSAAQARTLAHKRGQEKALKVLLKKLTPAAQHDQIEALKFQDATVYVRSLEIQNERTSNVRYLADLTVEFSPNLVREFMRFNNLNYVETESKPLLVVPVMDGSTGMLLWEEGNNWRTAWEENRAPNSLVPFLVPSGDIEDIRQLSVEQAQLQKEGAILELAERYRAKGVLLTQARLIQDPLGRGGDAVLEVQGTLITPENRGFERQTFIQSYEGAPDQVMATAVKDLTSAFEQQWKENNLIAANQSDELRLKVPYDNLPQWVQLRKVLDEVGVVRSYDVSELHSEYVMIKVRFSGTLENLQSALAQRDLEIQQTRPVWTLSSRG